jgi:lambda family phage tail tape measure protein
MANMIGRLGVLLGLDSAEFITGIDKAQNKLKQFAQEAVTVGKVAAVAFAAASYKALEFADSIADVAKANDVAIDSVLRLSNALAQAGGKADDAGKLLAGFTKFVDTAAEGSFAAQKAFQQAGISLGDLGKLSTDELFQKAVAGIAAIEDPLTRNAKAMEVFGKAAKGVDFVGLNEAFKDGKQVTLDQAKAVKDAADAWDMLQQAGRDVALAFTVAVGPTIKLLVEYLRDAKGESNLFGDTVKSVFTTIVEYGAKVGYIFSYISDEIKLTIENTKAVMSGGLEAGKAVNEAHEKMRAQKAAQLDFFVDRLKGNAFSDFSGSGGWDAAKPQTGPRRTVKPGEDPEQKKYWAEQAKAFANQVAQEQELARIAAEITNETTKEYKTFLERIRATDLQLDREQEIFDLSLKATSMRKEDFDLAQQLLQIEYKRADVIKQIQDSDKIDADTKAVMIQRENEQAEKAIRLAERRNAATKKMREGTYGEGFAKSMKEFIRDMPTAMEDGQRAFESVVSNMDNALRNFVRTGKISFNDLAQSIVQDLIYINLRAQAMSFTKSLFGGGGLGGLIGGLFGGSGGDASGPISMIDAAFFADGGNPPVGKASIVGERGPELFVPRTAGTIIPNNQLGGMGGTTNVTNNYIQAIDTKSFEDRIYGSANAIWAANRYGEKAISGNLGRA